ncbi:peroxiredoxin family protein [Sphingobacterium multivorum]|uniref:peroxiredoxin family protein n=1 Tax=Sphingobacterium multivorum TaxID=28454 RepID=UPI003DA2D480
MNNFIRTGIGIACSKQATQYVNLINARPTCIENKAYSLRELLTIRTLLVIATVFHMFSLSAQTPRRDSGADGLKIIKPLKIGDTVPDGFWTASLNAMYNRSNKNTVTLNELKNRKLIILDFWATWCGACIGSIQKYVKTDAYTDADIAFLGVTYQDKEEVTKFNGRFKLDIMVILTPLLDILTPLFRISSVQLMT